MNLASSHGERRRHRRASVKAAAFVHKDGKLHGSYHVENLSAGGVLLVGRSPIREGEVVEVLLQLPSRKSLRIPSSGIHCEGPAPFEYTMGLAFNHDSLDTERILQEVVLMELKLSGAK